MQGEENAEPEGTGESSLRIMYWALEHWRMLLWAYIMLPVYSDAKICLVKTIQVLVSAFQCISVWTDIVQFGLCVVKSIAFMFKHGILCIAWLGSVAKTINFHSYGNFTGTKRRLDRPFPWRSVKLFTTNQCFATTPTKHAKFECKHNWLYYYQVCMKFLISKFTIIHIIRKLINIGALKFALVGLLKIPSKVFLTRLVLLTSHRQ